MHLCAAALLIFLLLLPNRYCHAAERAILNIKNIHHWLDLSYQYEGRKEDHGTGRTTSYRDHLWEEIYHMDCRYAIYDYRILNGHFEINTGLVQEDYDSTYDKAKFDAGYDLEYKLEGIFFEKKTVPVSFFSSMTESRVARRFSQSYDLSTSSHGISVYYKSNVLPTSISYSHMESETSGLDSDSDQVSDAFNFVSTHVYHNLSQTVLSFYKGKYDTDYESGIESQDSDTTRYSIRNRLNFGNIDYNRIIESEYVSSDTSGYYDQKTSEWRESLDWDLGLALNLSADFRDSKWETDVQDRDSTLINTRLRHQLFESLFTHFKYSYNDSEYDRGEDIYWYWDAGFSYKKRLPADSHLLVSYFHQYGETDRDMDEDRIQVVDERLTISISFPNYLNYPDVIIETIVVRSIDGSITYQPIIDYIPSQIGRRTELIIPFGSSISDGETVLVSYEYLINPSIKYSTTVNSVSGSLTLFNTAYRIFGQYQESNQDIISGTADNVYLTDYRFFMLGTEMRRPTFSLGAAYGDMDSTIEKYRYGEVWLTYNKVWGINNIWINMRNRNTQYYETETTGPDVDGNENQFSAGAVLRRLLMFKGSILELGLYFLDNRGRGNTRTELSLELSIEGRVGDTQITLDAERVWLWTERKRHSYSSDSKSYADFVVLKIRRYF